MTIRIPSPRPRVLWRSIVAVGIAVVTAPAPSAAQLVLEGQVVDDVTHEPVASARVLLLTRYNKVAGYASTDEAGRFRFEKDAGWYRINIRAVGYRETDTPLLWMLDRGFAGLEIRLSPNAVLLAPVEIVALRVPTTSPVLESMLHRRLSGFGHQITRQDIEERRPSTVTDILMEVPGVYASRSGSGASGRTIRIGRALPTAEGECVVQVFVDGMQATSSRPGGDVMIDDLVHPGDVEAIEVFRGLGTIPPEFLTADARCGVIAIWTRRSLEPGS